MTQQPSTPLPWNMEINEGACFHRGNRVSITSEIKDPDPNITEISDQTILEIWPGDDDCDVKDGKFIMMVCHCHEELLDALETMLNLSGAARAGALTGAWKGLDINYHVDKARAAIAKVKNFKVETGD